jgi:hypothetical protein
LLRNIQSDKLFHNSLPIHGLIATPCGAVPAYRRGRPPAITPCARPRRVLGSSASASPNGRRRQCGAGRRCSGRYRCGPARLRQSLEAGRNGIARFFPRRTSKGSLSIIPCNSGGQRQLRDRRSVGCRGFRQQMAAFPACAPRAGTTEKDRKPPRADAQRHLPNHLGARPSQTPGVFAVRAAGMYR